MMEKDDVLLGFEMGRLEIEPIKFNKTRSNGNPFLHKDLNKTNVIESTIHKETQCACSAHKKVHNSGIIKKKQNKILKEPVLKLLKSSGTINSIIEVEECHAPLSENMDNFDPLNLCTLVHNCNQLKISPSTDKQRYGPVKMKNIYKWWKHDTSSTTQEHKELRQQNNRPGTCSQQALNPPCDITIDELASYFETLVHIPKKMSSMAEMMYI